MTQALIRYQAATLAAFQQQRDGETRLGQVFRYTDPAIPLTDALMTAKQQGCIFVLLGVPEDIGPRANLGQPGSDLGWQAFIRKFINLQQNEFLDGSQILLLGELDCTDLQQQSQHADLATLRSLCAVIDRRLEPVLRIIFEADLIPVVIGGGHNNSLSLLTALAQKQRQAVNCINLDPHADFRLLEGRHSGNGFSYAKAQGHLDHYLVMGFHELKNSASSLQQLKEAGVDVLSYQQLFVREQAPWPDLLKLWLSQHNPQQAFGIEVDTDAITGMPVSAYNSCGVSVQQAEHFVYLLARYRQCRYLHLAEAAPAQHPAGLAAGMNEAGQILTALVCAFLLGKTDAQ